MLTAANFLFMKHVAEYNLSYATLAEYEARQAIFTQRNEAIEAENAKPENTFTVGHNKFSTWTEAELAVMRGFRAASRPNAFFENKTPNADSVDWNAAGCVTPVKDQGSCGSCWAFSTTGSMEGAHCAEGNPLVSLSEQELVDCDTNDGNLGCHGGDMYNAMVFTEKNPLATETGYPYNDILPRQGTCEESTHTGVVGCTNAVQITPGSSSALMASIEIAPTSVAIEAKSLTFQFYTSGIINSKGCGTELDHGVTAVGYGSDNGQNYYLVKNSWNTSWGEDGYVRIGNDGDGDGICGIQMQPVRAVTN